MYGPDVGLLLKIAAQTLVHTTATVNTIFSSGPGTVPLSVAVHQMTATTKFPQPATAEQDTSSVCLWLDVFDLSSICLGYPVYARGGGPWESHQDIDEGLDIKGRLGERRINR